MKNTPFLLLVLMMLLTACIIPSSATPTLAVPVWNTEPAPSTATETLTPTDLPPSPTATQTVAIRSLQIGPDNFSQFSTIQKFEMKIDELLVYQFGIESIEWRIDSWTYSPDGRYAAFGGCTTTAVGDVISCRGGYHPFLYILDAVTGELITSIEENNVAFHGLSFSPDGKWLAYAVTPYRLVLWNIAAGQVERTLWQDSGYGYYPRTLISPDGQEVVLKVGQRVIIFDLATGRTIIELSGGKYGVSLPKYNQDGARLAIFTKDDGSEVAIYATDTWQIVNRLKVTNGGDVTQSIDFSGDGRWVANAISNENTEIWLWDAETGELAATLEEPLDWVFLQFSPDGRLLLAGGLPSDGSYDTIAVWDVNTHQRLGVIQGLSESGRIMFAASGETFMSGGPLGYPRWGLPGADLLTARQALTDMLDAMAAGDYEAAARRYQPSAENKILLGGMGYPSNDLVGTLSGICSQEGDPCAMEYQILYSGLDSNGAYLGDIRGEYLFILSFLGPDGSVYRDSYDQTEFFAYVDLEQDGSARVVMLPTLFYIP